MNLSSKSEISNGDISAKFLKKSVDIYIQELIFITNDCIETGIFPDGAKVANVSSLFIEEVTLTKKLLNGQHITIHVKRL